MKVTTARTRSRTLFFHTLLLHALLLLLLHPHPHLHPVSASIFIHAPNSASTSHRASAPGFQHGGTQSVSGRWNESMAVRGRGAEVRAFVERDGSSVRDMMRVVVCEGLQRLVTACVRVPSISEFMKDQNTANFRGQRKRRYASSKMFNWFGQSPSSSNSGGSVHSHDPWWGFSSFPSSSSHYGSSSSHFGPSSSSMGNYFGSSFTAAVVCPSQTNQSAIYQLNSQPDNYPAEAISDELGNANDLSSCLLRQIVLPKDGPPVFRDDFLAKSNATCPSTVQRLWRYQSVVQGTRCWILQNFQDNVLYTTCRQKFCQQCKSKPSRGDRQKLCVTGYTALSVWVFCPSRPQGQRILRDRLIIPRSCSCLQVPCQNIPVW